MSNIPSFRKPRTNRNMRVYKLSVESDGEWAIFSGSCALKRAVDFWVSWVDLPKELEEDLMKEGDDEIRLEKLVDRLLVQTQQPLTKS